MAASKPPLLVVGGPTASGKTMLAVDIAAELGGEIICADSMQVYRGMEIATAAPTSEERRGIPHHLFGILEPEESFSVAQYIHLARAAIQEITSRGALPILCGGTGLYISCLIDGTQLAHTSGENSARRSQLREMAAQKGPDHLWGMLNTVDPELAAGLHPNNLGRVIRAIEVYEQTGLPMSEWQRRSKLGESPYNVCFLALGYTDRQLLNDRIDRRVELMLEQGLLEEVKAMAARGGLGTANQAIGHKEFATYLKGEQTLAEATQLLKTRTRQYAKRQLTWLQRDKQIIWLAPDSFESYEQLLIEAIRLARETLPLREGKHES